MRVRRRVRLVRAMRKGLSLRRVQNNTAAISKGDILLVATVRNERIRMPYFLEYYRGLGVQHFLIIDNDSTDGLQEYLRDQEDVSVWHTAASYKASRFGIDWVNALLTRHAHNHWVLVVDPDELLVYPFCDTRPLSALTGWLDGAGLRSYSSMLLDVYPKGPISEHVYREGENPLEIADWFDSGNYMISRNKTYKNLWIRGGPRMRVFFADDPDKAPALNKIPLVHWRRGYVYISSTHALLPRSLNMVYEEFGGEKPSGVLMHTKFLSTLYGKVEEEMVRHEHYGQSREYEAYLNALHSDPDLWCRWSEKYMNWRQLEILGLMSKGSWT